jgi:multiple antibiotic resistance protein
MLRTSTVFRRQRAGFASSQGNAGTHSSRPFAVAPSSRKSNTDAARISCVGGCDPHRGGRSGRPRANLSRGHDRHSGHRTPRGGAARRDLRRRDPRRTALVGDQLLRQLGITLPAFRIAGGLLLFSIASEMVFGVRIERQSKDAEQAVEEHVRNIAAFPLAIPLMAGPGALTATVLLSGQAAFRPLYLSILIGVIATIATLCFLAFLSASRIERGLGTTGNVLLSKLRGVLLAALAVQYVIDGLRAVLTGS